LIQENSQNVQFKIEGPSFENGIPLLDVTFALQEFQWILDKSYLIKTNQSKMGSNEREKFNVVATEFRKGSFIADLQLVLLIASPYAITLHNFSVKELWEISKSTFDYLCAVYKMRSSGVEPEIIVSGDNSGVIINGNNGTIEVHQTVYQAAEKAEPHYRKLVSIIKKEKIESISALDDNNNGFVLTSKERELFNPKTQIENDLITLDVDIFRYDKDSNTGKLRVNNGAIIPSGEYAFKPLKHDPIPFILSMARPPVTVSAHKEIEKHGSGITRISKLHIVSIEKMELDKKQTSFML